MSKFCKTCGASFDIGEHRNCGASFDIGEHRNCGGDCLSCMKVIAPNDPDINSTRNERPTIVFGENGWNPDQNTWYEEKK